MAEHPEQTPPTEAYRDTRGRLVAPEGRACRSCGEFKPWASMVIHRTMRHGHDSICRPCADAQRMRRYHENRPAEMERMRISYQQNRDARREYSRSYHQENRDARREYNRIKAWGDPSLAPGRLGDTTPLTLGRDADWALGICWLYVVDLGQPSPDHPPLIKVGIGSKARARRHGGTVLRLLETTRMHAFLQEQRILDDFAVHRVELPPGILRADGHTELLDASVMSEVLALVDDLAERLPLPTDDPEWLLADWEALAVFTMDTEIHRGGTATADQESAA